MASSRGIPSLPKPLIRPTTQTQPEPSGEPAELLDAQADDQSQGRGVALDPKPKARRRTVTPGGETRGRKLSLPDAVFDRLQVTAIQRRKTVSAVAAEILDRNLPKLRIEREA